MPPDYEDQFHEGKSLAEKVVRDAHMARPADRTVAVPRAGGGTDTFEIFDTGSGNAIRRKVDPVMVAAEGGAAEPAPERPEVVGTELGPSELTPHMRSRLAGRGIDTSQIDPRDPEAVRRAEGAPDLVRTGLKEFGKGAPAGLGRFLVEALGFSNDVAAAITRFVGDQGSEVGGRPGLGIPGVDLTLEDGTPITAEMTQAAVAEVVTQLRTALETRLNENDTTGMGTIGEIAGQFVVPAAPLFKALQAVGLSRVAAAALSEGIVESVGVNPNDPNLANLLPEEQEGIVAFFRDLLATDPADDDFLDRARNLFQGLVLGGAGEKIFAVLERFAGRAAPAAGGAGAAAEGATQLIDEAGDARATGGTDIVPISPEDAIAELRQRGLGVGQEDDGTIFLFDPETGLSLREVDIRPEDRSLIEAAGVDFAEPAEPAADVPTQRSRVQAASHRAEMGAMVKLQGLNDTRVSRGLPPLTEADLAQGDAVRAETTIGRAEETLFHEPDEARLTDRGFLVRSPAFYSAVGRAIEKFHQPTTKASSWLAYIKRQDFVKNEELEWSGLRDYLKARKDEPIRKEEMLSWWRSNAVEIREVRLEDRERVPEYDVVTRRRENGVIDYIVTRDGRGVVATPNFQAARLTMLRMARSQPGETVPAARWGDDHYRFSGGKNYREFVAVLPSPPGIRTMAAIEAEAKEVNDRLDDLAKMGQQPDAELEARRLDQIERLTDQRGKLAAEGMRSYMTIHERGHYTHSVGPNVLWHTRVTDRVGPNGEHVLFIEELQSDWLQGNTIDQTASGRGKKVHNVRQTNDDARLVHAENAVESAKNYLDEIVALRGNRIHATTHPDGAALVTPGARQTRPESYAELWARATKQHNDAAPGDPPTGAFGPVPEVADSAISEAFVVLNELRAAEQEFTNATVALDEARAAIRAAVPPAPFRDTWMKQAFRRMVRYAADNDYDAIAWTNADHQVQRWGEQWRDLYTTIYDKTLPDVGRKMVGGKTNRQAVTKEDIGLPVGERGGGFEVFDPHGGATIAGPFPSEDEAYDWIHQNVEAEFSVEQEYRVVDPGGGGDETFSTLDAAEEYAAEHSPRAVLLNPTRVSEGLFGTVETRDALYEVIDESGRRRALFHDADSAERFAADPENGIVPAAAPVDDRFERLTVNEVDEPLYVMVEPKDLRETSARRLARGFAGFDENEFAHHLATRFVDDVLDEGTAFDMESETRRFVDDTGQYTLYEGGQRIEGGFDSEADAWEHYRDHFAPYVNDADEDVVENVLEEGTDVTTHYMDLNLQVKEAAKKGFPLFTVAGGVATATALAPGEEAEAADTKVASTEPEPSLEQQAIEAQREARLGKAIRRLMREAPKPDAPTAPSTRAPMAERRGAVLRAREATDEETHEYLRELGVDPAKVPSDFNLKNFSTPADIKTAIQSMSALLARQIDQEKRGVISHKATAEVARQLDVLPRVLNRERGGVFNAEEMVAARMLLATSAARLDDLATVIKGGRADESMLLEFRRAMALHGAIQMQVKGAQTEIARALSSFNIPVGIEGQARVDAAAELLREFGGSDQTRRMAERYLDITDPVQRNKLAFKTWGAKSMDVFNFFWINGLLSGPLTHVRNIVGTALFNLWALPEHALAATLGKGRAVLGSKEERIFLGEIMARFHGQREGFRKGLGMAARALKTGEPQNPITKMEMMEPQALSAEAFGLTGAQGKAVDLMGAFFGAPGRALMAEDEVFRAVAEQGELAALAYRRSYEAILDGASEDEALGVYLSIVRDPPADIKMSTEDASRYYTFTDRMEGRLGDAIRMVQRVPVVGRIAMPFGRTPLQITKRMAERTPLALAMPSVWKQFRNPVTRDLAVARIALGTSAGAAAVYATLEGRLTGNGPSDPARRAQLRNTGWQPWSIVIDRDEGLIDRAVLASLKAIGAVSESKDKIYVSYLGVEPIGAVVALAAGTADAFKWSDNLQVNEDLAMVVGGAFAEALKDRAFFKGMADLSDAITHGPGAMNRYLATVAKSMIPMSAAVKQVNRMFDPTLRDTRADPDAALGMSQFYSMFNGLSSSISGFHNSTLPQVRNLWGDKVKLGEGRWFEYINPFYISPAKYAPIDRELVRLSSPIGLPRDRISGTRLDAEEYERLVVIMTSEVTKRGKTFKEAMADRIESASYLRLSDADKADDLQALRDDFLSEAQLRLAGYRRGGTVDFRRAENQELALKVQRFLDVSKEAVGTLPPF